MHCREQEKGEESALRAELEQEQSNNRRILEEERSRILSEHISKLQGYIPKGVLSQVQTLFSILV